MAIKEQVLLYLEEHQQEMLDFWKELVNFQAGTKETSRIRTLMNNVEIRLKQEGMICRMIETGCDIPVLEAIQGADRKGKPIVFCGHLDTVFPSGSYPDEPFAIRDGRAYGPGVNDMKGGIVMAVYIARALNECGYAEHPIKMVFVGDEETGHAGSRAPEILKECAEGAYCAFNFETGRMDNGLSVGRKGNLDVHVTVRGKGGHVGNDFLTGRNAVEEMAHKIVVLQALSRYEEGIIVSADVIRGGTVSNSIPDFCQIEVDCRFDHASDLEMIKNEILDACSKTVLDGTTTEVEFINDIPVFEKTEKNLQMLDMINETARELEMPEFIAAHPAGNSDASYLAQAGIPVICSCGVQGPGAHTMEEYAVAETMFTRSKILAVSIINMEGRL